MLTILFTILHVLVSLFLILVVLAQQGKGQDLASAFGGGGSQTAFGARGTATLLSKITAGAAALFVVTSLTLSYLRPAVGANTVIPESEAPAVTPSDEGAGTGTGTEATEPPAAESGTEAKPPSGDDAAAGESQSQSQSQGGGEGETDPGTGPETPPPPKNP